MSDEQKPCSSSSLTLSDVKEVNKIDEKLDVMSEKFDPLLALYSNSIVLPKPNVKPFDNLESVQSAIDRLGSIEFRIKKISDIKSKKTQPIVPEEVIQRRFEEHQMLVPTTKRKSKNILLKLEQDYKGPLKQLNSYVKEKKRIKVFVRRNGGIRGYVTGFISAFDKQWNLAMYDVFECWKRRKEKYRHSKGIFGEPCDMSMRLRELKIKIPKVKVKNLNRKNVECERKIAKLFIRGEQVSHITLA